jgi:hypothetical protein
MTFLEFITSETYFYISHGFLIFSMTVATIYMIFKICKWFKNNG